ncbi:heavy metal translocating P-type ATPase [Oryzomicrobium sp.]|uniref:heavy metal translocating P-type ATPase n=1 Tax=Oryzomicrobium sp. TaxID=1911578 RepID=UPI0025E1FA55|nr:heavy metal translocating P-type ATPase [Oryzomicrobium sp.]MCE1242172.1 heavy metal translocating P-type ATPase [Oryzomicrobium sp.]
MSAQHEAKNLNAHPDEHSCGCNHACNASAKPADGSGPQQRAALGQLLLRVPAMDCPTEEAQIRRALEQFPAIRRLSFDLAARTLSLDVPTDAWSDIQAALKKAGFDSELPTEEPSVDSAAQSRNQFVQPIAALLVAIVAEAVAYVAPETLVWKLLGMGIAGVAIALSGLSVFKKGLAAILRGQLNINALMSVAVAGAFVIGEWPEAAMVMALYAIAELIEARAVDRARNAIKSLLELSPQQTEVRQPNGSWLQILAKEIQVGQIVRVRPGERFALDGKVTLGNSAVDQSPVTGESMPIEKGPGDEVFAGTINQSSALEFEVTAPASDTVLARIIHAVEEAQGSRAPTQRFVDRFAAIYTPGVFVLAVGVALVGPLALGWTWMASLYKALVMLVIACPCALVISTPVTVVSGLAAAARRGILIKGGAYLEEARKLKAVALDKTGTVTEGRPKLVAQVILSKALPEPDVLRIAFALAGRSDHPVSKAVATGLALPEQMDVQDFGAEAGRGVFGTIAGHDYVLGNHRWIHDRDQCSPELEALLFEHERQGRTVAILANRETVLVMFAVADTIKASSQEAIGEMLKLGVTPVMLTGDNPATASSIAAQAGIQDVRANLLPEEKLDAIRALASVGDPVAMVGDGINDAPALATADIGFAMGSAGTHTAMEAADVVIMNDDLRRVPETIRLSMQTHSVLWQNITLALGIKFVFLLLALFDHATMWMAVFADMGASLLVVFNGLRLLRDRKP